MSPSLAVTSATAACSSSTSRRSQRDEAGCHAFGLEQAAQRFGRPDLNVQERDQRPLAAELGHEAGADARGAARDQHGPAAQARIDRQLRHFLFLQHLYRSGFTVNLRRAASRGGRMSADRRLRSSIWFEGLDKTGFMHRAVQRQLGLPDHEFHGKPIIGICNSWSDLNPCNGSLRELAEHVKRGVWEAGGVPLEFSVHVAGRGHAAPQRHAVPQPRQHGGRGIDPRQPAGRRRPAGRLRQDHAGTPHGSRQRGPADHRRLGRPHAQRPVPGQAHRHQRCLALRRGAVRRHHRHGRVPRGRARHQPLARHLPDHGHRLDHGLPVRGAGHRTAPQCRHPGRRREPSGAGPPLRQPHRRAGPR